MLELNYKELKIEVFKIEVEVRKAMDEDIFHFLSKLDLSFLEPLLLSKEYKNDFHFRF